MEVLFPLLIVPVGIEMCSCFTYFIENFSLLIVPVGIEMNNIVALAFR